MTREEYNERLIAIRKESNDREYNLATEYAMSNNPYKVGDIIEDHRGKLKIEKIKVRYGCYEFPYCYYLGVELKKDGTPYKRQTGRYIIQGDIKQK